jgi:FMN-dependent NADH-azoreductase
MDTILDLTCSIFGEKRESSRLSADFVAGVPNSRVIRRDRTRDPVAHLDHVARRALRELAQPERIAA